MPPKRAASSEEGSIDERHSSEEENELISGDEGSDQQMSATELSSEADHLNSEAASSSASESNHEQRRASFGSVASSPAAKAVTLEINIPEIDNASQYEQVPQDDTVDTVLQEFRGAGNKYFYTVLFEDGREEDIQAHELKQLRNGTNALDLFLVDVASKDSEPAVSGKQTRSMSSNLGKRGRPAKSVTRHADPSDDEDELSMLQPARKKTTYLTRNTRLYINGGRTSIRSSPIRMEDDDEEDEGESDKPPAGATRSSLRTKSKPNYNVADVNKGASDDEFFQVVSDIKAPKKLEAKKDGRGRPPKYPPKPMPRKGRRVLESSSEDERPEPSRRSGRNRAVKSMREVNEDEEVYAEETQSHGPKVLNIREVFQPVSQKSPFRALHNQLCEVCKGKGTASNKGQSPLIYCQGCSSSIHKACLDSRSVREHIVTKIDHDDFVLQCRRCIGMAKKKDPSAPRFDICQSCKVPGVACAAFSTRKTTKQEEKLRLENEGVDPITVLRDGLVNNPENVLFRCFKCHCGFHYQHLPPLEGDSRQPDVDEDARDRRIAEYSSKFICKDCDKVDGEVQGIVAWRPVDIETYNPQYTVDDVAAEDKEFLIKWADKSYFQCTWMTGAWAWGMVSAATKKAFAKRDENQRPKMTNEDAIPEEYLRMEIILAVEYTSVVNTHTETIDRARIKEVDQVLVKFQGLGYEESVWESPPDPDDEERYSDFVAAYNEYLAGIYFKQPPVNMRGRIEKYRNMDFESQIFLEEQPAALTGGKLMGYQMEGMNWLLSNYHRQKSVILADEMGLGKTLQIIAMIAALIKDKPQTWPFLVVVPNSTCPNWRREIKTWAPTLRVVAYYGSKEARDMAMRYELFPEGRKDMSAHIVVTSFEGPVTDDRFFRKIKWAGVIVDEGQRLKNDKNQLYHALLALNTPFKVLMTGTPLQNNKRELFNLLQFIDDSIDAEALDEEYAELTNENIPKLHDKIKPYFLRRTKATALSFLPPLAQVIVPVTMCSLQKQLYKSILSRNPELMRSIYSVSKTTLKPAEKGNLNNILMQLRKVLCHPFMFSQAVEERALPQNALHRNLVQASAKLQLLDIMLPKLHERGHRVLIFSQFLDQLDIIEDFLVGLGFQFERLDGSIGTLEKQKRIDSFNAPDSPLFAFLLSTRAGGVGINLATADTVIIMDPDFNPHQDCQALSRAHRIGQKKKVLVFQLMTKDTAEEKIVQIGRKKMALDHVLIESLDQEEDAGVDLESILKHGASALFADNDENDIHYSSASIDKLLDRTGIENTNAGTDKTAESAFSAARVWANDKGALEDEIGDPDEPEAEVDVSVWDKLLEERAAHQALEAEKRKEALGKGKRVRKHVNYNGNGDNIADDIADDVADPSPKGRKSDHSDTDFAEDPAEDLGPDTEAEADDDEPVDLEELRPEKKSAVTGIANHTQTDQVGDFRRAKIAQPLTDIDAGSYQEEREAEYGSEGYRHPPGVPFAGPSHHQSSGPVQVPRTYQKKCLACGLIHMVGYCTLKRTGHEHCGLCGLAHYGGARACPHMQSETQVRSMLRALKVSTESKEEKKAARKYLQGVIGNLVMKKKKETQRTAALLNGHPAGIENQPPASIQSQNNTLGTQHQPLPAFQGRPMQPSRGNNIPSNAVFIDLDSP